MVKNSRFDLTGQTFGRWTVLSPAERDKQGRARWRCRCSCGNERIVSASNLRRGMSTSCGHDRGVDRRADLAGMRYGRLTVIRRAGYDASAHASLWECQCDCGGACVVSANNLQSGHTTSCGCIQAARQQDAEKRVAALKASPLCGRFETHRAAKKFVVSKDGRTWDVKNLRNWVRNHTELFDIPASDPDVDRVAKALYDAAANGYRWHGWMVAKSNSRGAANGLKCQKNCLNWPVDC